MKKLLAKSLNKISRITSALSTRFTLDKKSPEFIQMQRAAKWFEDQGDKTHRLNYDLNSSSLVMDLGGYEGQWASDIYSMYNCALLVFEPYLPFADKIESRFKRNENIKVYKFGLGPRTENVSLSILDNSSSIFNIGPEKTSIKINSVIEFLKENNIASVDLIKINIEGAEYELLECLLESRLITKFKNIQVQFHDFIMENASERMTHIQQKLSKTHELTYQYEFVWENWKLKA